MFYGFISDMYTDEILIIFSNQPEQTEFRVARCLTNFLHSQDSAIAHVCMYYTLVRKCRMIVPFIFFFFFEAVL